MFTLLPISYCPQDQPRCKLYLFIKLEHLSPLSIRLEAAHTWLLCYLRGSEDMMSNNFADTPNIQMYICQLQFLRYSAKYMYISD